MGDLCPVEVRFQLRRTPAPSVNDGEFTAPQRGRLPRVTQVLALAIQLDDAIQRGEAKDCADLARLGGVCRERVSQIMRLLCLAPDIQVELLYLPPTATGRYPVSERAAREIANILYWADQRQAWIRVKQSCGV